MRNEIIWSGSDYDVARMRIIFEILTFGFYKGDVKTTKLHWRRRFFELGIDKLEKEKTFWYDVVNILTTMYEIEMGIYIRDIIIGRR